MAEVLVFFRVKHLVDILIEGADVGRVVLVEPNRKREELAGVGRGQNLLQVHRKEWEFGKERRPRYGLAHSLPGGRAGSRLLLI